MALIDNVTHYWKFNESSGNVLDFAGSFDMTVTGATQNVTGIIDKAISFDGDNDFTSLGSNTITNATNPNSINFWIKFSSFSTNDYIINFEGAIFARLNSTAELQIDWNGASNTITATGVSLDDNNWHMITMVFDSGTQKLYIDKVLRASASGASKFSLDSLSRDQRMGSEWDGTNFYNGLLTECGFWSTVLTDGGISVGQTATGEVAELYNSNAGLTYPFTTATLRLIRLAGTFVEKPILTKVSGTFVDKPIKIKVGGTFQDA